MTEHIQQLATIAESLAKIAADLAALNTPESVPQTTETVIEDQVQEDVVPVQAKVKIPSGHNYVVVSESDYIDDLTLNGRQLLGTRATFEHLDDAREFARFATERPIYVGEVVIDESSNVAYTRLKLSYLSEVK